MKGLIVLAIAVHLVTVQGSRIIQENLDYEQLDDYGRDYISTDRRDAITAWKNLDEIWGMGIDDAHPEKRSNPIKCEGLTCKICFHGLCMGLTHNPEKKQFFLHLAYHEKILFDKTIDEKEHEICKSVKVWRFPVNGCLKLTRLQIVGNKVCTSAKISVSKLSKTFDNMCM